MWCRNSHRFHSLLLLPALLPIVLLIGSKPANKQPSTPADAYYTVHGSVTGLFPFNQPIRLLSNGSVSHGTLRVFTISGGFSQDSFIYQPFTGYTGPDSFTYHACDSSNNCVDGTIYLDVVNNAPDAVDDYYTLHGVLYGGGDTPLTVNDSDADGDPLDIVVVSPPSHGRLTYTYEYDGFVYVPDLAFIGLDTFTYTVCDSFGLCDTGTVFLTVLNNPPEPLDDRYKVRGPTTIGPFRFNDSDPDPTDGLAPPTLVTAPSHGTLTDYGDPDLRTYEPNPGYLGWDSFVYQVCDNLGLCANAGVYLQILPNDRKEDNGRTSCRKSVGAPINVTTGNMYLQQTDYVLPGVGPAINFTRTYNSSSQDIGLFGKAWSSDYDESIKVYNADFLRWLRPDGQATNFMSSGSGQFAAVEGDFHGGLTQNGDGSLTMSFKDGSVHRFSPTGKLLSLVDQNGNQTTLTYTSGKLSSITDPFGRVVTATTDAAGRVLTLTDTIGKFATYAYGGSGELLSVTYADNSKYQFAYTHANGNLLLATVTDALGNILENHTYDAQGRAITSERHGGVERYTLSFINGNETDVTDGLGRITRHLFDPTKGRNVVTQTIGICSCGGGSQTQSWTYDDQMNVISHTNGLAQTVTYTYDVNGNQLSGTSVLGTSSFTYNQFGEVLTATDAMDAVTTYTYDPGGNLLSVKDALANTTSFAYNARGQLLTMANARGKVTTLAYDTIGNISQTTDAAGNVTRFTYDARGRLISITDALNFKTSYAYDAAGRLSKITRADKSVITFTYDPAGRWTAVTDPLGNSASFAYESAYRLIRQTDALGNSVNYGYDSMSNLTAATDQLGHTTNLTYDEFNRPTSIVYPPTVSGGTRLQESVVYDAGGNLMQRTDTANRVTSFVYDNANRLVRVIDPLLQPTQYEYDARSNVTAVVDALNQRYTFDYDALSRVTAMTRADGQMTYAYDVVGNRTRRTDYNNAVTNYQYDDLNRLTRTTYPDTSVASYAYDELSQLISATNANGTVTFAYDKLGRVTDTTDVWGQSISYAYDLNGRRTQMKLGSSRFASYSYDAASRLTKISEKGQSGTSYTYDAAGNLVMRALVSGVVTTYTYDGMDRLTKIIDTSGASVIADNNYAYNNAGQIVQNLDQSGTHAYGYDAVDRLISASYPATGSENYSYDAVGNRTSSHRSASYGYLPFNRLTTTDTGSYVYDNNGNLTSKNDVMGATSFVWDFENRLTNVTTPSAGSVTYKYDALGRRIQRAPSNGPSTNFSYDGADVVRDRNSDGSTIDYQNGPGIDNKIWQKGATQYFFSQDHLGSTTALTNASGVLVERETYDAYGNTAGSALTRYGFTGRERDPLTGLMYYRARWYDPQLGRFISEDPIGLAGGINQFAYVGNDPQNRRDPSGLYEIDVHYYLTYYLALKTGCFTDWAARDIANENQQTDENSQTLPGQGTTEQQRMQNRIYHDFTAGAFEGEGSFLLWQGAMNEKPGIHHWIGRYLHHLQDSFSHAGYADDVWGHATGTHGVDKTASDPEKAQRMAAATWKALVEYARAKGCSCDHRWDDSMWPQINAFINVATDDPKWSTIDATERALDNPGLGDSVALTRKRRIFGLVDRYTGLW